MSEGWRKNIKNELGEMNQRKDAEEAPPQHQAALLEGSVSPGKTIPEITTYFNKRLISVRDAVKQIREEFDKCKKSSTATRGALGVIRQNLDSLKQKTGSVMKTTNDKARQLGEGIKKGEETLAQKLAEHGRDTEQARYQHETALAGMQRNLDQAMSQTEARKEEVERLASDLVAKEKQAQDAQAAFHTQLARLADQGAVDQSKLNEKVRDLTANIQGINENNKRLTEEKDRIIREKEGIVIQQQQALEDAQSRIAAIQKEKRDADTDSKGVLAELNKQAKVNLDEVTKLREIIINIYQELNSVQKQEEALYDQISGEIEGINQVIKTTLPPSEGAKSGGYKWRSKKRSVKKSPSRKGKSPTKKRKRRSIGRSR